MRSVWPVGLSPASGKPVLSDSAGAASVRSRSPPATRYGQGRAEIRWARRHHTVASAALVMRVTHSRRIFVQQLGRGLRVSRQKDKVIVLDFVSDLRRVAEVSISGRGHDRRYRPNVWHVGADVG